MRNSTSWLGSIVLGCVLAAGSAEAANFTVNSNGDGGAIGPTNDGVCNAAGGVCTLRAAIQEANGTGGTDTIRFSIGPATISIGSALPPITSRVTIDGTTSPAFVNSPPYEPVIRINGNGRQVLDLQPGSSNSTIRGLAITNGSFFGIRIQGSSNNVIAGNFVGTNLAGTAAGPGNFIGIYIGGSGAATDDNRIGGTVPADRNLISANTIDGIEVTGGAPGGAARTLIQGNYIGTDVNGTADLGNVNQGVAVFGTNTDTVIGGAAPGAGNVISGNDGYGLGISTVGTTGTIVQGNKIGVGALGAMRPNNLGGFRFDSSTTNNLIGGTVSTEANTIAHNGNAGVRIEGSCGSACTSILGNDIYSNGGIGIDLNADGVTGNDAKDIDTGPNSYLNFPNTTAVLESGGVLTAYFQLDVPSGWYRIDFFKNPSGADGSGFGEGEVFVDAATLWHPGGGLVSFTHAFSGALLDVVTATTTQCTDGTCTAFVETSEFGNAVTATPAPVTHYRSIGTAGDYTAGTIDVTAGSATVTANSTFWLSNNRGRGDRIDINGNDYTVLEVVSDTELTLTTTAASNYSGAYTISRQFATLQAWESCISGAGGCIYFNVVGGNLVSDNRKEVGIAYADSVFNAGVDIMGSTTDAAHFITLTADGDNRHYGLTGAGVVIDGLNTVAGEIFVQNDYTVIQWLEVTGVTGGSTAGVRVSSAEGVRIEFMMAHDSLNGFRLTGAGTNLLTIRNSIAYRNTSDGFEGGLAGDRLLVDNLTVWNNGDDGIDSDADTSVVRNTISLGNVGDDYLLLVGSGTNNIDSDGTAPGTSALSFRTATDNPAPGAGDWVMFQSLALGTEDLHLRDDVENDAIDAGVSLADAFTGDIDGGLRTNPWDVGADDVAVATAVTLESFEARPRDGAVELRWRTSSELDNLGFHLHRATTSDGKYELVTERPIPGLGSSPSGAGYRYLDSGLTNGATYFYKLEDIETTGATEFHGPVSGTPRTSEDGGSTLTDGGDDTGQEVARIAYGNPATNMLRELRRTKQGVDLELVTGGFYALPQEDGSVRLEVPGFESLSDASALSLPVKRTWLEAVAGRKVTLVSIEERGVESFASLRPSTEELPEIVATPKGSVRVAKRGRRARGAPPEEGLYPSSAARVVSVGFQGDAKKGLLELVPLRWDGGEGKLLLARRLLVRVSFREPDPSDVTEDGRRGRRNRRRPKDDHLVAVRLHTTERGLHAVRYEEVAQGRRGLRAESLRLSRQGKTVAFHVGPDAERFEPGSLLYFLSAGPDANPYGLEAVYELELGHPGVAMPSLSRAPSGDPQPFYWQRDEQEQERYYQAALVDAPDLWLWDLLFAPQTKSYPFEVTALASTNESSRLTVWLQGASDFPAEPDHHVRLSVNGSLVDEVRWDGKDPKRLEILLGAGLLVDGQNELELDNVGDTEALYSMVMLDRFALEYPRIALSSEGRWEGRFPASGTAELGGLGPGAVVVDTTDAIPAWLVDVRAGADGRLCFRAEPGHRYLAASPEAIYHPRVSRPRASHIKEERNRADYVVIGPEAFLEAAAPLLEWRRSEGLEVRAVSTEEIFSEFGFGEATPDAVKDFLRYAYHEWEGPSLRYVLLLGDATYDFKDALETGVRNQVPPLMVKTSFLWAASDPTYAAVNGEDSLPDLAIGRLPAATVDEVRVMVDKVLAYETGEAGVHQGAVVLVADNPDHAGNFEADADALANGVLASTEPQKIYLRRLGPTATRNAILQSFDDGVSLMSYIGHGGIHLWADENFFNTADVASLGAQSQQPILLTMNCLNGYYHFPYFNSLAEELVKAKGKGAIAAFSPTGLSLDAPAQKLQQALLAELWNGTHARLGDAVLAAQADYAETGAFPELLTIFHLLGDPALRLK